MDKKVKPISCPNDLDISTTLDGKDALSPIEQAVPKCGEGVRGTKTICIYFDQNEYQSIIYSSTMFREFLDKAHSKHPELFPSGMSEGYALDGMREPSVKLGICLRRIKIGDEVFSVCPSFVMPYMTGFTKDVENALLLRGVGVPYWILTHIFGRNDMYWYRMEMAFGRQSIVGTTVKRPERLPKDLLADEKHTSRDGEKAYVATTVGENCVLGASVCSSAGTVSLTKGYGTFAEEVRNVDPEFSPETVNTDGWEATQQAWTTLFPSVVVILCFLHGFIKIRDRCKKLGSLFDEICTLVWNAYHAKTKRSFAQRIRRLREWAGKALSPGVALEKILALCAKGHLFGLHYDYPNARRTSNMLDRLMRWLDRSLFNRQYFHRSSGAAELAVRSWAILANYRPYSPRAQRKGEGRCAAERLNGFRYHDNWLVNLRVASSMGGFRQ